MRKYKYTNKEERPIPKYKNGDIAWFLDGLLGSPQRCVVRSCCNVRWFESNWDGESGWWIEYRYKPDNCERMKQHTIYEEDLYDTEQEALLAQFKKYKNSVRCKLEYFNNAAKRLGMDNNFMIENKKG